MMENPFGIMKQMQVWIWEFHNGLEIMQSGGLRA